eukprot:TRINITY_DN3896_c0_g1_i11.p1 TRINITY_DN3896_c0_g1~~TRINITY_DN3896_c0_g1_i11.p1  ORF type:complete len:536 (-),score=99.67 TRINITY_DN3896_c0_g1_i11:809-2416(-)
MATAASAAMTAQPPGHQDQGGAGGGEEPNQQTAPKQSKKPTPNEFYFGRTIGEGAFSTVYLVKDVHNKREYAAKVCNKMHIKREKKISAVMREKEILLKIKENWNADVPFFVKLFSTFQDAESLYFIMTYAERGDFFTFLRKAVNRGIDVTRFYAGELIQAVEHLHRIGIVHRDLKPENILLDRNMHILLTDFGSGKILKTDELENGPDEEANRRASFVGTAQYVSPEVLTNSGCTPAADLWAVGCIIYQMLAGMPPFQAASEFLIFEKIRKLEYSFQDGFDDQARELVQKLIVIDPASRLGSTDIQQFSQYSSIKSHPFFRSLDFASLSTTLPPLPSQYTDISLDQDPVWERYPNMTPGLDSENRNRLFRDSLDEANLTSEDELEGEDANLPCYRLTSQTSCIPESGNIGDLSEEERTKLLDDQRKNNEYHRFVEENLILKQGILDKKKGLWSRRRMFLLTEGPRLFYVDPKEKVLKGEVPLSVETRTEMKNFKIFFVHTPDRSDRIYYLIDPGSYATQWCKAIDAVIDFYYNK